MKELERYLRRGRRVIIARSVGLAGTLYEPVARIQKKKHVLKTFCVGKHNNTNRVTPKCGSHICR